MLSYVLLSFVFHVFVFLDSTPGSTGLSETEAINDAVGGEAEATVHHISSSSETQGTPCKSFLID